jgi:hypothetical protein
VCPINTREHLRQLARRLGFFCLIGWLLRLLRGRLGGWLLRRLMPADYRFAGRLKLPWLLDLIGLIGLIRLLRLRSLFGIISRRSILPVDYRITSRLKWRTRLIFSALI